MAKNASDFWMNITQRQKDMRVTFNNNQTSKKGKIWDATMAPKPPVVKGRESSQWKTGMVFQFIVSIPALGLITGGFKTVRGLNTDEWEFETYREGGDNGPEHILVNHTKAGKIELEWALRNPDPFMIWAITTGTGVMVYNPMTITLLEKEKPIAMWTIPQCLISKIQGPELNALSSEIATNKIELVHTGIIPIPM